MYLIGVLPGGDERNQKQHDGSNLCIEEASYQGPMDAHPLTRQAREEGQEVVLKFISHYNDYLSTIADLMANP